MLKSLELFGFKSFADRTRFDFSTGITGVVGPNGSGKSNVVDAMKWILGDQSAKSLRGKDMTDVIFNGSAGRKPSAYAEATITFDNASGWLPSDAQEIHIGRRIWRNGDAEYLLNRATARLKDIKDLFMGTGAGTSAYSIIEQGRVDQILQANPTSRRAVFEEAAGISRFKSRRIEAQRKLERVAQNLERLTDIVDEVEAQLNSTRSQAAKAAKYREVSVALKQWWFGLAADDYRHLSAELEVIEEQLASSAGRVDELTHRHRELEEREAAFDADLSQLDDELRGVDKQNAAGREVIAGHDTTIQYQLARLQELESELLRLHKQQLLLGQRAHDTADEISRHEQRQAEFAVAYSENRHRCAAHDEQLQSASLELASRRQHMEQDRTRRLELTRIVSDSSNAVTTLRSQIATISGVRAKLASQLDQLDGDLATQDLERARCLQRVDEAVLGQTAAQQALRDAQNRRGSLLGEQEETKQRLAEQRERRSAALARKSLLEDLELRQEGLGIGVKDILSRARSSPYPPWNTIVGSVADLLDVDLEHAALLEVALGARAQLIVLREYQALLDYLNQGTVLLTNRVGFVAIPDRAASQPLPDQQQNSRFLHMQLDSSTLPDLSREPGVVTRADGLVLSDRGTTGLAASLLADTWVVNTMDDAVRLALGPGKGLRFVTLQGELLEANGTLYVGTIRSETALFSRKSELRRLKNDLLSLDRDIAAQEGSLQLVYQSLTGADSELEAIAAELDYANQRLSDLKNDLASQDQTLERLRRERDSLARQQDAASQELDQRQSDLTNAEQQAATSAESLNQLEASLAAAADQMLAIEQRMQGLEQQRSADQLDLAKQEERLEAMRIQSSRLTEEVQQRVAQYEEATRRCQASAAKQQQILLNILNTRAVRDEQLLANEHVAAASATLHARKLALRVERSQLVEQELAIRKERRELSERRHAEEMRLRDMRHNIDMLNERLDDEYQLKLTDVVASGASAMQLIADERQARLEGRGSKAKAQHQDVDRPVETEESDEEPTAVAEVAHSSDGLTFTAVRPEIEARVNRLRKQLKLMGSVNTDSLNDLEMLESRFLQLSSQLQDLVEAKNTLEDIIRKINGESRRLFAETFHTIRTNFQELFRQVFGGGEGDIVLEDPNDVLDCGIDIAARPPGKELRSISLLSGGEKTMTAIALIMAIFKSKPSPFCILDEVDAALDEANVERFTAVVQAFQQSTQFIMITHHKRSMTVADVLYGVTMEESGVSKRMSVRFEDVSDDGHFRTPGQSSAA
ncbi:MAG: chromosome segregation protein SMC [Planctomycetes bacterium]|nr:chromosome segregation protein SMC [Planctomycetota bacterium]